MSSVNANLVKEINLNKLRNAFKLKKTASKPQLAELTGLSVVTINSLVRILVENGEVIEDVILPSNGGISDTIVGEFKYRFNSEIERIMIPEIVISKELNHDFEIGIKQIALKALEPTLQLIR